MARSITKVCKAEYDAYDLSIWYGLAQKESFITLSAARGEIRGLSVPRFLRSSSYADGKTMNEGALNIAVRHGRSLENLQRTNSVAVTTFMLVTFVSSLRNYDRGSAAAVIRRRLPRSHPQELTRKQDMWNSVPSNGKR
jgi:hypothetical protein